MFLFTPTINISFLSVKVFRSVIVHSLDKSSRYYSCTPVNNVPTAAGHLAAGFLAVPLKTIGLILSKSQHAKPNTW